MPGFKSPFKKALTQQKKIFKVFDKYKDDQEISSQDETLVSNAMDYRDELLRQCSPRRGLDELRAAAFEALHRGT